MKQSAFIVLAISCGLLSQSFLPVLAQYTASTVPSGFQPTSALQTKIIDIGQRLVSANGIKEPIRFTLGVPFTGGVNSTLSQNPGYGPDAAGMPFGVMPTGMALPPGISMPSSAEMAQAMAMMSSMGMSMPNMSGMGMPNPVMPSSGEIAISQELMSVIGSDDELAAVLAHEIAHLVQDPVKEMQRSAKKKATTHAIVGGAFGALSTAASIAGGFAGPAGMIGSQAIGAARGLTLRGGEKMPQMKAADEKKLDSLTLQYMVKAGYKPSGLESLYQKARVANTALPPFFMIHQVGSARIENIHSEILKKYPQLSVASNQPHSAQTETTQTITTVSGSVQPVAANSGVQIQTVMPATVLTTIPDATQAKLASVIPVAGKNTIWDTLPPEESRVLSLIHEKGYLPRVDLNKQFNALEVKALPSVLDLLIQKKLIRLVGTQPNDGFVLTDNASQMIK